ncbi:hypothetical protein [Granulicella tundricola]|uniref:hypothetical protein n=1 Tax=Granulicella tundricola TaxID=940615 RepID=UPI0005A1B542|nr:hypothetical protein [Granulicella tundricola]
MAMRTKETLARGTSEAAVISDHKWVNSEPAAKDRANLIDVGRQSELSQEVQRLEAQAVATRAVIEQLWQALADLREWHKEEYQSCRRIDEQADAALALLPPANSEQRLNYLQLKSACKA